MGMKLSVDGFHISNRYPLRNAVEFVEVSRDRRVAGDFPGVGRGNRRGHLRVERGFAQLSLTVVHVVNRKRHFRLPQTVMVVILPERLV